MELKEKTDKAIEEYNEIVDEQAKMRAAYEELEQKRLVLLGQVQTLSELLSAEKSEVEEETEKKPAPKSGKAAE